jgi:hypothetical protein
MGAMPERRDEDPSEALRRLDARDGHTGGRSGPSEPGRWQRLRRQLRWLLLAALALGVVGFGAGWLFGLTSPPTASRLVLGDQVETEPDVTAGGEPAPGAEVAPTSGETDAEPRCGVVDGPVAPEQQLATLAAGGVALQYRPGDVTASERAEIEALVAETDSHVLIAPNPDLPSPVVATAWQHRLELDEANAVALRAFVDGYRRPDPDAPDCPH